MNLSAIKSKAVFTASRSLLKLRKVSPDILVVAGVVGVVATAVMASRATLKLEPVLKDISEYRDLAVLKKESGGMSDSEYRKELTFIYFKGAGNIVKLYTPTILVGAASIGSILGAHGILRRRNIALIGAYKALDDTFAMYRDRVRSELGEEHEKDLLRGVVKSTREYTDEDGNVHKKGVKVFRTDQVSQYARFFDELNPQWQDTPGYNLMFLRTQQQYANDLLMSRGHLFLNEVYDMLKLPRTKAGAAVGWVFHPQNEGDNFVDFGIYDEYNEKARDFVNGYEKSILLDFNVDGVIWDKIDGTEQNL